MLPVLLELFAAAPTYGPETYYPSFFGFLGVACALIFCNIGAAYGTAKTGLNGLVRALAVALARHQIRVNSLLPGWTITELASGGYENDRFREVTTRRTPARRWADPSEFREVGAFLADPNQTFHTGQEVTVDGGYTVF